jgi:hypothetical protein
MIRFPRVHSVNPSTLVGAGTGIAAANEVMTS